jgi:hypothetical protein
MPNIQTDKDVFVLFDSLKKNYDVYNDQLNILGNRLNEDAEINYNNCNWEHPLTIVFNSNIKK